MEGEHLAHSPLFDAELTRHREALTRELTLQVRKLYRRWLRPLDPSEVEDEVQSLFVGLLQAKRNYDPIKGSFKAWANAVAMRRLADRQRQFYRESKRPRLLTESSYPNEIALDLLIEYLAADRGSEPYDERIDTLLQQLDRLPEKERDAIRRRYFAKDDYATIARALGVTEAAARGIVCRGLDRLGRSVQATLRKDTRVA